MNLGTQLGLRGPWGPTRLSWLCPFLAGHPALASESPGSLFKKSSPRPAAMVLNGAILPLGGTFGNVCTFLVVTAGVVLLAGCC